MEVAVFRVTAPNPSIEAGTKPSLSFEKGDLPAFKEAKDNLVNCRVLKKEVRDPKRVSMRYALVSRTAALPIEPKPTCAEQDSDIERDTNVQSSQRWWNVSPNRVQEAKSVSQCRASSKNNPSTAITTCRPLQSRLARSRPPGTGCLASCSFRARHRRSITAFSPTVPNSDITSR